MAAFATYSCMYAFRKPFAAATFDDLYYFGIDYKILLITAQVLGYTLSKFIGIKVVSEMKGSYRSLSIVVLIAAAGLALLGFALVPAPWNIVFLFLNGLPLGMVWGLVFSFLEGRKVTEVLGAGLSVSFIFSSGLVKSAGKWLMLDWGVTEYWMPFITGMLFFIPMIGFVFLLEQVPPPDKKDEALRTRREPMDRKARWKFFRTFSGGLILMILVYTLLTAFRDFRDNFAAEIWNNLGYGDQAMIFTLTEIPVAILVLLVMGLLILIRNNLKAFLIIHILIFIGVLLVGAGTYAFELGLISPPVWMTLMGLGLYLGYVPFNSVLFDRMIAVFRYVSNAGFLIYLADAFGYLGSVAVLFYRNFYFGELNAARFFIMGAYWMSAVGMVITLLSMWYYYRKQLRWEEKHLPAGAPVEQIAG
jgi:hypothetical protein